MLTKRLSFSEFCDALPSIKRDTDTQWAKILLRPLSLPTAWALYRVGISGNAVSLSCVALAAAAAIALAIGDWTWGIIAAVVFNVVALGDCVDGNIARASGRSGPGGEWIDALAGYSVYAVLPLALGWRVEQASNGTLSPGTWMLVGAIGAVTNLFMRLLHQKYINSFPSDTQARAGRASFISRLSGETGLAGWMMPALLIAVAAGWDGAYLLVFSCFYFLSCAAISSRTAFRVILRSNSKNL